MLYGVKRESRNGSDCTYLQERQCLLQCAKLLQLSSQRLLNQAKSKLPTVATALPSSADQLRCSKVSNTMSCVKKNAQNRQSICSILKKSNSLAYSKTPRDPEKFLAKQINSSRQVTKERMEHLNLLAKPKHISPRSPGARATNSPHSGSDLIRPHLLLHDFGSLDPKSVACFSSRLLQRAQSKSSHLTQQRRLFQPSPRFGKSATSKPYSPSPGDPIKAISFQASERIQYLALPKWSKAKNDSRYFRNPQSTETTPKRAVKFAECKMDLDEMMRQSPYRIQQGSKASQILSSPKQDNFLHSIIKLK